VTSSNQVRRIRTQGDTRVRVASSNQAMMILTQGATRVLVQTKPGGGEEHGAVFRRE
jgi:hypothetical protein